MNIHEEQEHQYMRFTFWLSVIMAIAVLVLLGLQIIDTSRQAERATIQARENAILIESNFQLIEDLAAVVEAAQVQRNVQTATILCAVSLPVEQRNDEAIDVCRNQAEFEFGGG